MPSIPSLIAAHRRGDAESLQALGLALARGLRDTPDLPLDPVEVWDEVDTRGAEAAGTWQEVRAARDYGELTEAEYDYLSAAVEALTQEEQEA